MSLKIHLFIVSFIILTVFVFWQWMQAHRPVDAQPADTGIPRAVEIIRASWGLNCRPNSSITHTEAVPAGRFSTQEELPPLRENNILTVISALCNGKPECAIRNSADAFGADPAPDCTEKEIVIEYRCFSYDRPWILRILPRATGVIHCQDQEQQPVTP